jgi:hypothetical protein
MISALALKVGADSADDRPEYDRVSHPRPPLWATFRGAPRRLAAAWVAWMALAAAVAVPLGAAVGRGGVVVSVLTLGWLLARRLPDPGASWRRYHVDDVEVTSMGPGRRVRRLAWDACRGYAGTAAGLRLEGAGAPIVLPLPPAQAEAVWRAVLTGIVPGRADALWRAHEQGAVRLAPALEPDAAALASWAWMPAALAALLAPSLPATGLAVALAAAQCLGARARSGWRSVVLQPSGVVVPGDGRRCFVAWDEMRAEVSPRGLEVHGPRGSGLVCPDVPDFMAVAAVIRLRADLGLVATAEHVSFRVAYDGGGLAIVGEIEGG